MTPSKARLARTRTPLLSAPTTLPRRHQRIPFGGSLGCALLICLIEPAQAAPNFSDAGSFTLSVEDVTGYESRSTHYDDRDGDRIEETQNRFALAVTTGNTRVGFHYFVIPHLSLGGTIGFENSPRSITYANAGNRSETLHSPTGSRVVIAPRVGYALMFKPEVGLWFRGGIGYERDKQSSALNDTDYIRNSFGMLSADIFLAWSPVPHFGVLVGPTGDIAFTGSHYVRNPPNNSWSNDAGMSRLALMAGVFGYF
jgi:hypothetical protein